MAGLIGVSGCSQMDEPALRAHLSQWFALGNTMSFGTGAGCTSAAFRLVDTQIGSGLGVVESVPRAVMTLKARGAMALNDDQTAPDAGLIDMINADRTLGYRMRRAALEGRVCMDDTAESAFRYALVNPRAVLAYDAGISALMLLDPDTGVLVVAIGEEA